MMNVIGSGWEEQVDKHLDKYEPDFAAYSPKAMPRSASVEDVRKQVCAVWAMAGPVVTGIARFGLIPARWREAMLALATGLEVVCATSFEQPGQPDAQPEQVR